MNGRKILSALTSLALASLVAAGLGVAVAYVIAVAVGLREGP